MKTLTGTVVSLKNKNTAAVEVENRFQHPLYKKYLRRSKKYACQVDEGINLTLGQKVTIVSCRPVSKTKAFKVLAPTKTAKAAPAPEKVSSETPAAKSKTKTDKSKVQDKKTTKKTKEK
ncbi:MAG: 30S ribosomal protein S17 [bacterium]|nr:30S ribosomal protein S17 [bacterium]